MASQAVPADARPVAQLGCSKCRYAARGCGRCRRWAAEGRAWSQKRRPGHRICQAPPIDYAATVPLQQPECYYAQQGHAQGATVAAQEHKRGTWITLQSCQQQESVSQQHLKRSCSSETPLMSISSRESKRYKRAIAQTSTSGPMPQSVVHPAVVCSPIMPPAAEPAGTSAAAAAATAAALLPLAALPATNPIAATASNMQAAGCNAIASMAACAAAIRADAKTGSIAIAAPVVGTGTGTATHPACAAGVDAADTAAVHGTVVPPGAACSPHTATGPACTAAMGTTRPAAAINAGPTAAASAARASTFLQLLHDRMAASRRNTPAPPLASTGTRTGNQTTAPATCSAGGPIPSGNSSMPGTGRDVSPMALPKLHLSPAASPCRLQVPSHPSSRFGGSRSSSPAARLHGVARNQVLATSQVVRTVLTEHEMVGQGTSATRLSGTTNSTSLSHAGMAATQAAPGDLGNDSAGAGGSAEISAVAGSAKHGMGAAVMPCGQGRMPGTLAAHMKVIGTAARAASSGSSVEATGATGGRRQCAVPRRRTHRPRSFTSPMSGSPPTAAAVVNPRLSLWSPPVSPYGLLEEELYQDPWRVLLACVLLNKTSAKMVRTIIWKLLDLYPTPEALAAADVPALEAMLRPLGLFRQRALSLRRFSLEYLEKQWSDPRDLHGIGPYGSDAYYMFCRGAWRGLSPKDKDLRAYHEWLTRTDGLGSGLQRGDSSIYNVPVAALAAEATGAAPLSSLHDPAGTTAALLAASSPPAVEDGAAGSGPAACSTAWDSASAVGGADTASAMQ